MEIENNIYDFSVIICCYNPNFDQLIKTIISTVKQKDVSFEIIIADDGSKKDYRHQLEEWAEKNEVKNIVYNFLPQNGGTVKNIISGAKISRGKYIKAISPGDYFFDDHSLYEYFTCLISEENDLVYSDTIYYSENKIVNEKASTHNKIIYNPKKIKKRFCLYNNFFLGCAFASKRDIYLDLLVKLEDIVIYTEDLALNYLCFLENKKYACIKKPLIWYEYGTGISTHAKSDQRLINDRRYLYNFLERNYIDNSFAKKMIKKNKIEKKSRFKKTILYLVFFPGVYLNKLQKKILGFYKYDVSIEQMNEITNFDNN